MIRKLLAAATAFSMIVAPIGAQATERHSSKPATSEHLAGISPIGWLLGLAVVAGVIVIIATDHHHAVSP